MSESRPVIVYDSECRFCLWSVGRIRRFDRTGRFEYLPRQTAGIRPPADRRWCVPRRAGRQLLQQRPRVPTARR